MNNFPALKMTLYHGAMGHLYVRYGVNEEDRYIYIQAFGLLPGSPLVT